MDIFGFHFSTLQLVLGAAAGVLFGWDKVPALLNKLKGIRLPVSEVQQGTSHTQDLEPYEPDVQDIVGRLFEIKAFADKHKVEVGPTIVDLSTCLLKHDYSK